MLRMFVTTESGMCVEYCSAMYGLCSNNTHAVPIGPPQNFNTLITSHTLTLSWSPPLFSHRNGVIISYLINCTVGGVTSSNRISGTSQVIAIDPFTNYACTVSAATDVGMHGLLASQSCYHSVLPPSLCTLWTSSRFLHY